MCYVYAYTCCIRVLYIASIQSLNLLIPGLLFLTKLFLGILNGTPQTNVMVYNVHGACLCLKSSRTINIQGAKQYQCMNLKVTAILLAWLFTGKVVAPVGCQYRPYTVC